MIDQVMDAKTEELLRRILDPSMEEHLDRVSRLNARTVLANGGALYQPDGYRNGDLLEGCNLVRAYLMDVARDLCIDLDKGRPRHE
jgi:hypothetical protein